MKIMASEKKDRVIFEEDEVSIFDGNQFKCGLVLQSTEYFSTDEEEEAAEELGFEKVKTGTVRVAWHPDGKEEVVSEGKLLLEDRSLMPGDVIRRLVKGQDSQRGYVTNTNVKCHLRVIGTEYVITNIDSRCLEMMEPWQVDPGDVYMDSWVGKIHDMSEVLHLKLPDGTMLQVDADETGLEFFEDVLDNRDMDSEFYSNVFYEGQYLKATLRDLHKLIKRDNPNSTWLKRKMQTEVVCFVDKVEVKKMEVHWLCRGYAEANSAEQLNSHPSRKLKKEHIGRLKALDCFSSCSIQLGDRAMYTIRPEDDLIKLDEDSKKPVLHRLKTRLGDTVEQAENEKNASHSSEKADGNVSVPNNPPVSNQDGDDTTLHSRVDSEVGPKDKQAEDTSTGQPNSKSKSKSSRGCRKLSTKDSTIKGDDLVEPDVVSPVEDVSNPSELLSQKTRTTSRKMSDSSDQSSQGYDCDSEYESDQGETLTQEPNINKKLSAPLQGFPKTSKKIGRIRSKRSKRRERPRVEGLPIKKKEPVVGDKVAVEIIYTVSSIAVMWQDGHTEQNLHSSELYPIHHLDELEFFPGDYVISSATDGDLNTYGVVESVSHSERTCKVHWMKPYQVGKDSRPDETISSEEVSVYDIKDHPDYKFRPGHVIVRVGGYEGNHIPSGCAAGQVFELCQDGRIYVQWADSSRSHCYPQEVYLIENELSELNDSMDESDSDEDFDSENTNSSWETEEEEEAGVNSNNTSLLDINSVLCVEANQKTDLDQSMEEVMRALQEVEEEFDKEPLDEHPDSTTSLLEDLLRIHQQCRTMDKSLKTSYFKDTKLQTVIQAVRNLLDKEREDKMARKARYLHQVNVKGVDEGGARIDGVSDGNSADSPAVAIASTETESEATKPKEISEYGDGNALVEKLVSLNLDQVEDATNEGAAALGADSSEDGKILCLVRELLDLEKKYRDSKISDDNLVKEDSDQPWWFRYRGKSEVSPVVHISKLTCRCIREQLGKVHADLNKKWEELKKAGKLKILEETEESSEDDEVIINTKKNAETLGASATNQSISDNQMESRASGDKPSVKPLELKCPEPEMSLDSGQVPMTPQTPADVRAKLDVNRDGFVVEDDVPSDHKFFSAEHQPNDMRAFTTSVRKELKMLRNGLPKAIFVKGFETRMDLYSVMMIGPSNTPYEDGLFFFDIQLPNDYPSMPPRVHYISFCSDRLNPNLYEDGKVCVSLLGTWTGKGTEVWTGKSSLLQVLISIQGLILVPEPYYNEAGYEKQKGSQHGEENSRMYNEMAILKMVQSMARIAHQPPQVFREDARAHIQSHVHRMISRLESWLQRAIDDPVTKESSSTITTSPENTSFAANADASPSTSSSGCQFPQVSSSDVYHSDSVLGTLNTPLPEFSLFPLSKGFQITLVKYLQQFKANLMKEGYVSGLTS